MSLGPYCDALQLTENNLLDKLPSVATKLNNGQAYELMKHVQHVRLPWKEIRTRVAGHLTDGEFCPFFSSRWSLILKSQVGPIMHHVFCIHCDCVSSLGLG